MDFKNFVINHVDRILEYLQQTPLVVHARRSVDAYLAAYAVISTFGETAHVSLVDWPPQSGVCIGFKCDGLYVTEREVGVDGEVYKTEFTSLSHLTYVLLRTLSPVGEGVKKALHIGHYSWSVDHCEYRCQFPQELLIGDEKLSVAFPYTGRRPPRDALVNSTLPIVPGVFGREVHPPSGDYVNLLDWALGVVVSEGFHTAVLDKAIRPYSPSVAPADAAVEFESVLAGFPYNVDVYIANLADSFYTSLKKTKDGDVTVHNPFYVYKLPPYLSYYLKLPKPFVLKFETSRGYVAAVTAPRGETLKKAAAVAGEFGQVLELSTYLVVYVEKSRYGEFFEKIREAF